MNPQNNLQHYNPDAALILHRNDTAIGELTAHEEILNLRRQLGKLNRRVLNIEISNEKRVRRRKIACCLGLAYFVLKSIFWLNRN